MLFFCWNNGRRPQIRHESTSEPAQQLFEQAVTLTASLAQFFHKRRYQIRVLVGEEELPYGIGDAHFHRHSPCLRSADRRTLRRLLCFHPSKSWQANRSTASWSFLSPIPQSWASAEGAVTFSWRRTWRNVMNINRALRLSAILQASIGLAALTGTGKLPAILIGIGCISIAVAFLWFSGRSGHEPKVQLPRAFWNVVLLAAVAATAADFMCGSQDFLLASLYVLILLVTHKLSTLQDHADFLHYSVLSFLEFLAAAVLTVELWYGIVFILYLVSTVWTLLLWHLSLESREATHNCGAKQAPDGLPLTVRFFWATNIMAVAALGLTLAIFGPCREPALGFFKKQEGRRYGRPDSQTKST